MSKPGVFACDDPHPWSGRAFSRRSPPPGYEVVTDTRGTLLWDKPADGERPLLILTSCQASREYLDYLEGLNISWIACGEDKLDLVRACEILKEESAFSGPPCGRRTHQRRFPGGRSAGRGEHPRGRGHRRAGRHGRRVRRLPMDRPVTPLKLTSVQQYGTGAVWLRYHTEK